MRPSPGHAREPYKRARFKTHLRNVAVSHLSTPYMGVEGQAERGVAETGVLNKIASTRGSLTFASLKKDEVFRIA